MLLDIREMQHIVALGRFRSFRMAAESLGISQPALSKSIRAIERSLEVRLFERSRHGVSTTVFGEAILSGAGPVLRSVDEVLGHVRRLKGLEAGSVRVGAGPFPLELSVAPTAIRLASRHPSLQLRVVPGEWGSLTQEVLAGSLDVAVAEVTAAEQEPLLSVERIGAHTGVFYCRAGHPLLSRAQPVFKDIFGFPMALNPLPARFVSFLEPIGVAGRLDPASGSFLPSITLNSVTHMKQAVSETDAISWAPKVLIAAELRSGSFVKLPFAPAWARLNYGIIRRRDRLITPALDKFLAELRAVENRLPRTAALGHSPPKRRRARGATSK